MASHLDRLAATPSTDATPEPHGAAPGRVSMTQRLARGSRAPAAVQRAIDPAAAAVQRAQIERDTAAAMGFFGGPAPTIDASVAAVQRQADAHTGLSGDAIAAHAAAGVAGAGQPLPHLEAIQRAFGPHDVGGVRAHVGGAAADASTAIGAHAYATGNDVAFARAPDLFLAAHEAAHVVQQRQGVQLSSAVGQDGDAYERHADAVAAAVVRGESAAELLGAPGAPSGGAAVQRWTGSAGWLEDGMTATGSGLLTGNRGNELVHADGSKEPFTTPIIELFDFGEHTTVRKPLPADFQGGQVSLTLRGVAEQGLFLDDGAYEVDVIWYLGLVGPNLTAAPTSPAVRIPGARKRTVIAWTGGLLVASPGGRLALSVTLTFLSLESSGTSKGVSASGMGAGVSMGSSTSTAPPGALGAAVFTIELPWAAPAHAAHAPAAAAAPATSTPATSAPSTQAAPPIP